MADSIPKNYKSTAEIPVSDKMIDQVIGQERSVELIRKAAIQKRNLLLIGLPGIGKSMLALDPNNPKVKVSKAGRGKKIVNEARIEAVKEQNNSRLIGMIFPLAFFLISFILWQFGWIHPGTQ